MCDVGVGVGMHMHSVHAIRGHLLGTATALYPPKAGSVLFLPHLLQIQARPLSGALKSQTHAATSSFYMGPGASIQAVKLAHLRFLPAMLQLSVQ